MVTTPFSFGVKVLPPTVTGSDKPISTKSPASCALTLPVVSANDLDCASAFPNAIESSASSQGPYPSSAGRAIFSATFPAAPRVSSKVLKPSVSNVPSGPFLTILIVFIASAASSSRAFVAIA